MKTYIHITKSIVAASVLSAVLAGCSEDRMDEINKDINHTTSVEARFILTDVITSTAFSNVGGDFNTYGSSYIEYEVGIDNQLYNAEIRLNEPSASTTFNNTWGGLYTTLKNARIAIKQCQEGGRDEGNDVTRGISEVLAAYNSALLTDMFGDTPYSEAALMYENGVPVYMLPKIDAQKEIYGETLQLLDKALADLLLSDKTPIADSDLLYGGDAEKWTKLAYGLKARYTMRLLDRSANRDQDLKNILEYVSKSFASASEQAEFALYDANNINPLYGFFEARAALATSESLGEKLAERSDPRMYRAILSPAANGARTQVTGPTDKNYVPAPNGSPEQSMQKYGVSVFMFSQTAPTILLSYHELKFLEAEALCRLGRKDDAEPVLKEAIVAGLANAERSIAASVANLGKGMVSTSTPVTPEEAAAYFDTKVKPLFDANPLKETMIQKYLAFWGASGETTEAYNDVRRLKGMGEDFITLKNKNKFPLRMPYGNTDTSANPVVKEAYGNGQYVYSEPVWWAGGTR